MIEAETGPIETKTREEVKESSALAELAFNLARRIDQGKGNTSLVRELRAILKDLTPQKRWAPAVGRRSSIDED